jgi:hypothetical protein
MGNGKGGHGVALILLSPTHTKGDPQTVSLGSPIVWMERKREEELMNSAEGETRD